MEIEGYRSAAARGRLKLLAWLIAVPLYLFQFVLLVVFVGGAVWAMIVAIFSAPRVELESAVVHEGALWMSASGAERRDGDRPPCDDPGDRALSLIRTSLEDGAAPEQVLAVCFDRYVLRSRLVSQGPTLLWLADDRLLRIEGGAVVSDVAAPLPSGARVIAHPSLPMAARVDEDATTLYVLEGEQWIERERRRIGDGPEGYGSQVVSDGARLHFFRSEGNRVVHRVEGGSEETLPGAAEAWSATVVGGAPLVFALPPLPYRERDAEIVVYGYEHGGWSERARARSDAREVGAIPGLPMAVSRTGRGLRVHELEQGALVVRSHEGASSMWRVALWIIAAEVAPFALALLAALLISLLMGRYRVSTYREGVEYASLARRSIAKIIDSAISLLPFGVAVWLYRGDPAWLEGPGPMAVALGSGVAFFLLFAALEGATGATPGKWLTGIRVTTLELEPCGFGGGVMRGLGGMVDGLLSGFVGLLAVTFGRHWQRIGDRLAGTIVIRPR